MSVAFIGNVH